MHRKDKIDLLHSPYLSRFCLDGLVLCARPKLAATKWEKAYSNDFLTQLQGIVMAVYMHQADRKSSSESAK